MAVTPSDPDRSDYASHVDLRRLMIFVRSAKELSFAAAAQHLGLTPSAVSHAIRSLEEELDCVLFQRHGPRVSLTRAAIRLLPLVEDLLGRIETLKAEVSRMEIEAHRLRVVAPEFLCAELLPRVLPDFYECFPSFRLELSICESAADASERIREGQADLYLGPHQGAVEELVSRDLFSLDLKLFVAPFHNSAKQGGLEIRDLVRQRVLVPHEAVFTALQTRGMPAKGNQVWVLPSIESVREFGRVGLGIAVLPETAAAVVVDREMMVPLEFEGPRLRIGCGAFWAGPSQLPWSTEAFLSFVETVEDL